MITQNAPIIFTPSYTVFNMSTPEKSSLVKFSKDGDETASVTAYDTPPHICFANASGNALLFFALAVGVNAISIHIITATKSVDLFFEKAIACDNKTDLYIEVEEIKNSEEKSDTKYQFDSLVIFLSE